MTKAEIVNHITSLLKEDPENGLVVAAEMIGQLSHLEWGTLRSECKDVAARFGFALSGPEVGPWKLQRT